MTIRDDAEARIKADPIAFIRYELADDGELGRKSEYFAVISEGHVPLQIDRATADALSRAGLVKAGPFDPKERVYIYHQIAAAA